MVPSFIEAVSARVLAVLGEPREYLPDLSDDLTVFLAPALDLLSSGKRTRARLCFEGWRCAGGSPGHEAVVLAGSALELFQAAALVHDDIIDDADMRRGMPSAHVRFAEMHRQGADAPAARFGASAAILLGDLLLVLAQAEIGRATRALSTPRTEAIWNQMTGEVAVGQYLDVRASLLPLPDDSLESALAGAMRVVRHKSARYSVEHPLVLGAALGGADEDVLRALGAFGAPLGEAFQLRDDELGVFGDPGVTGKPAGDDLLEGKRTPLILIGLQMAGATDREFIRAHLGDRALGESAVERIRSILVGSGAVERHEHLIRELRERALAALAAAPVDEEARTRLEGLADSLTRRRA